MSARLSYLKAAALFVVLVAAGSLLIGANSFRKDLDGLRAISRDNILWAAAQMEVELLRFQRSLLNVLEERDEPALHAMNARLDILWSRLVIFETGPVGAMLRRYDEGFGTLPQIRALLEELDVILVEQGATDEAAIEAALRELDELHPAMRAYSNRVMHGQVASLATVRDRMRQSAQITSSIAAAALLTCLIALALIARESRRQRELAEANRRLAEAAQAASEAKSRFLTMMSHELRNPLNGILGPLALVAQSDFGGRQRRLLQRAQVAGRIMSRMLRGLLDYSDVDDDRLVLRRDAFKLRRLAEEIQSLLGEAAGAKGAQVSVDVAPDATDMAWGDPERIVQLFVYIGEHLLIADQIGKLAITLDHDDDQLIADIALPAELDATAWTLGFLRGQSIEPAGGFGNERLGPLIARGLLRAFGGMLTITQTSASERRIRVAIPAPKVVFDTIRVRIETRSAALATLYRAALKSDRVTFTTAQDEEAADIVLVDSTTVASATAMQALQAGSPKALFVSMGHPSAPSFFDEIVEGPNDMARLRTRVFARLAS